MTDPTSSDDPTGRTPRHPARSDGRSGSPDLATPPPTPPPTRIRDLLEAVEPRRPKSLGELVTRLADAGLLVGGGSGRAAAGAAQTGAADEQTGAADDGMSGIGDAEIRGVAYDSRQVRPASLFVAVPGAHVDGHAFVPAAIQAGAAAVVVERSVPDVRVPQVVVDSSQRALAQASAWWYEDPSRHLAVVGITGTDGKTTTSYLATAALRAAGVAAGMIGTIATEIGGIREANDEHATTPEAPRLQVALRAMVAAGDRAAVIETTSHGLALDRVGGIDYDVAVLTNLTHEHLEFHGTFEAYRAAKRSLFERLASDRAGYADARKTGLRWPKTGVVNADDASAEVFIRAAVDAGARVIRYGRAPEAEVRLLDVDDDGHRLHVRYRSAEHGDGRFALRLAGRFNAHNALAVVALGDAVGLDPAGVRAGLESVTRVPGRMERIDVGQPFGVVVDYAHSPASLETVLDLLGPIAEARSGGLIAVFGSAGERDRAKRPMMGRIAAERCRLVVVTDEDPRGEDRDAILEEIAAGAEAAGAQRGGSLLLIADRRDAIRAAFGRARPGDVVLLAGKGHEPTILMADSAIPWDERAEAVAALTELRQGSA